MVEENKSIKIVPRFVVRKGLSLKEISNNQHLLEYNAKNAEALGEKNSERDNEKQSNYDRDGGPRTNNQQNQKYSNEQELECQDEKGQNNLPKKIERE